ncbi:PAS domain-containing protein [Streptomyces agglomeratus]|uniref:PAS domain-containing protein n=1 Tax=Streptomyces agglomeratus TaxID=285458 RepID=UPI000AC7A729|nr:PAS domain-containing protein [Streptomyces agglomeratus]
MRVLLESASRSDGREALARGGRAGAALRRSPSAPTGDDASSCPNNPPAEPGGWIVRKLEVQAVALTGHGERVMTVDIDFTAFFDATPSPYLMLDTDLVIRYANAAYLQTTGRTREQLIGKYFFDALPESPGTPYDTKQSLKSSLRRVLDTRQPDTLVLQRYDIPALDRPGGFEERWWSKIYTPIPGLMAK